MVDWIQDAIKCAVCSEVYQAGAREPVTLPCGHTFCRACLTSVNMSIMHSSVNFLCPTCRQSHNNVRVDLLSINYSLLSLSTAGTNLKYETCGEHGDDLKYWCCGCDLPLCSLCLYSGHPQGHNVQLAKAYVQEQKVALEAQIKLLDKQIEDQQKDVRENFVELVWGVNEMFQENSTLHNIQLDVVKLLDKLGKVSSIKGIKLTEESLRGYRSKLQDLLSLNRDRKADEKSLAKENNAREADVQDVHQDSDKACVVLPSQSALELLASRYAAEKVKEDEKLPRFALDCRDGRLLLHSLPCSTDSSPSQQLPFEVFLELSIRDLCLGRVYFHLWSKLRLAHRFLATCLGTVVISFLNVKATNIINKGSIGETLVFKTNILTNVKPQFTGLEFGNSWEKVKKGLLLVLEQRETPNNLGGSFGICTKDAGPGNVMGTAFGEVVSGLEVVKAAVAHNPVTEVTISQCGMVLPHLTL